jgi:hypothetical protein
MAGLLDPLAEYELIVPDNIPGTEINAAQIAESATSFATMSTTLREKGAAVLSQWEGLAPHYEAPESADMLRVMDPVGRNSTTIADKFATMSTLLQTLSDTVDPIQKRLVELKNEAATFRAEVVNGVEVEPPKGIYGTTPVGSGGGSGNSYSTSYNKGQEPVEDPGPKIVPWHEDFYTNSRNRTLIREVNAQVALLDAAQATCVNGLRAMSTDSWNEPEPYVALTEDQLNQPDVELPWGPATRDIGFNEAFGYSIASNVASAYQEYSALGTWNAETQKLGDWDLWVSTVRGSAMSAAGLALSLNPVTWMNRAEDGEELEGFKAFEDEAVDGVVDGAREFSAWDTWSKDPAQAAGLVAGNLLASVFGGAGSRLIKSGRGGSDSDSDSNSNGTGGTPNSSTSPDSVGTGDAPAIDVDGAAARANLSDLLDNYGERLPEVDTVPGSGAGTPDGTRTPGNGTDADGAVRSPAEPNVTDGAAAVGGNPDRDPSNGDGAGGGDSGTPDPDPSATENLTQQHGANGSGTPSQPVMPVLADPNAPPGPVRQYIEAGLDPLSTTDAKGPGWERLPDKPLTPAEVYYGAPHAEHGSATMPTLRPDGLNQGTLALVADPQAPWGRDRDGTPLTQLGYEERFVNAHRDWTRFPFNDGAVRGTRVQYNDLGALIRDYGGTLDRIGPESGKYLGLRVDGVAAPFESRALPVSSLNEQYFSYDLNPSGSLPPGWSVEVSRIQHGVGRVGGETQLKFFDEAGIEVPVENLHGSGILSE